jgi:hypothetical protein
MTWLLLDVPLMVLFFALIAGIPLWIVLKHPDRKPTLAAAPAIKTMPPLRYQEDDSYRRVA